MSDDPADRLLRTPLHDLHLALGARMVGFAGYQMPVQYPAGVLKEHLHCRAAAGLFDVSHMGQIRIEAATVDAAARALERLVPADIVGLAQGRQRYALLTDAAGGIRDDLMVARMDDHLLLVVNAATKADDLAHLAAGMPDCRVTLLEDRALIALQGPGAAGALSALVPDAAAHRFMDAWEVDSAFGPLVLTRSGYTGEDGFEIGLAAGQAEALARALLARPGVAPVGLGARDSLRLEAGLCLYGADIDRTTSPVEAGLAWAIGAARRKGGARAGGFPGADRILAELAGGAARRRVGLLPEGRAPMRAGTALFAVEAGGEPVGRVTSGAYGPSLGAPVAMGYVPAALATTGATLWGEVRGRRLPVTVAAMPFRAPSYRR